MGTNVGTFDAATRWVLAAAFFLVSIAVNDRPAMSLTLAALAVVMIATALTKKCPLYTLAGITTGSRERGIKLGPAGDEPRRRAESIKAGR